MAQPYPPGPGPRPPQKPGKGLLVSVIAAGVAVLAFGVTAIFALQPVTPRTPGGPETAGTEQIFRTVSQFAGGDDGGWDCENNCRFADGRLHLSAEIPPGAQSTDWWVPPVSGWASGNVHRSAVVVENVSFEGYADRSFLAMKCGATIANDELVFTYQAELLNDRSVQFYRFVDGKWEESGTPASHSGDAVHPGDVTFRCEQQGPDFRFSVQIGSFESETVFKNADRQGSTLLSYGGYAAPGARVGVSMTGVRYEAAG